MSFSVELWVSFYATYIVLVPLKEEKKIIVIVLVQNTLHLYLVHRPFGYRRFILLV